MSTGTALDLFGGIRGTIFAGLAALATVGAVGFAIAWQVQDARLATCKTEGRNYQSAQDANKRTIEGLIKQIADLVATHAANDKAASEAAAAAAAERKQIAADLAATEKELQDAYAKSQTARAWARTGVDRAVVDRLPWAD